jgi:hypothetical protein
MSLTALTLVLSDVAIFGVQRGGDEGAAAHVWQILMAGQAPLIIYFAFRWLPQSPKRGFAVLALQVAAAVAACAPVYLLKL